MRELLPQIKITLMEKNGLHFIDSTALFGFAPHELWLEIGFGGGEHLAAMAAMHPANGFIGCEPFVNGVASLMDHIDKNALGNIRVFPDDARRLLDALPDASIGRCFVLFPDPWPKARHAERRFVGPENLARLARVLKKGAELHCATDDAGLVVWIRERLQEAPEFFLLRDSLEPPEGWTQTRYEQKGIKAGRKPVYMTWRRI